MNISDRNIEQNVKFFDQWAKNYDIGLFQFWMRRFYQPVFQLIGKGSKCILDVSCGTGEFLQEMKQKRPNAELYGVDISEKMIEVARKKLPNVRFSVGNVHDLRYKSNYFDCVITTEAFHHYYDQQKALGEMARVAKNGGKVIVSDINFYSRIIHWLFEHLEPGCVRINSKHEMKRLFEYAGLHVTYQKRSWLFAIVTVGRKD